MDAYGSSPATRSYADAAWTAARDAQSVPTPPNSRTATPEPVFCTLDVSRVPEEHAGLASAAAIRNTVEREMRTTSNQPNWRCVAVTRDGRSTNRLRVVGRTEEEMKQIKDILEARKAPGARVLRDQLYPVKIDNVNRTGVIDQTGEILPGAVEALGQENEVQIAKISWLSRKDSPKAYGSMVVYLAKAAEARRILKERYFIVAGESAYTSPFERRVGPVQCYNCQEIGHKAFSCPKARVCARCAAEGHRCER